MCIPLILHTFLGFGEGARDENFALVLEYKK